MSVFEKVSDNFSTFKNLAQPLFTKAKYKIDDNINMHSYSLLYEKYLGFKWFLIRYKKYTKIEENVKKKKLKKHCLVVNYCVLNLKSCQLFTWRYICHPCKNVIRLDSTKPVMYTF